MLERGEDGKYSFNLVKNIFPHFLLGHCLLCATIPAENPSPEWIQRVLLSCTWDSLPHHRSACKLCSTPSLRNGVFSLLARREAEPLLQCLELGDALA